MRETATGGCAPQLRPHYRPAGYPCLPAGWHEWPTTPAWDGQTWRCCLSSATRKTRCRTTGIGDACDDEVPPGGELRPAGAGFGGTGGGRENI